MNVKKLAIVAMIAAIYATITIVLAPISFGAIQVRLSEVLTLLPIFYWPATYGVILGCFIANLVGFLMGTTVVIDVIVGTAATALAALITYHARNIRIKDIPVISILSPVICNGIIIGAELAYVYTPNAFWPSFIINGLEVALGEAIACIVLYPVLLNIVKRIDFNKYN